MGIEWEWSPDPWDGCVGVEGPSGAARLKLEDAYVQWMFGAGKEFRAGTSLAGREGDFSIAICSNGLTSVGAPLTVTPETPTGPLMSDATLVHLLPVAQSSLPQTIAAPVGYVRGDDDIDPDKLVITGVVDDGFNPFLRRFRPNGCSTRIEYFWAQDAAATSPSHVPFGMELTRDEITASMDVSDERTLMRRFGLTGPQNAYQPRPLDKSATHGNHIADLACGANTDDVDARNNRMVLVQFPALSVADTSGASLIAAMQTAAIYIFDKAFQISLAHKVAAPVVLNISYALTGGARTGHHFVEQALHALAQQYRERVKTALMSDGVPADLATPPVVQIVPIGNEHLNQLHARCGEEGQVSLQLRVQPEDRTSSFVEIWVQKNAQILDVQFTLPDGTQSELTVSPENPSHLLRSGDAVLCRVKLDSPLHNPAAGYYGLYWRMLVALAPSALHGKKSNELTPPGLWNINVSTRGVPSEVAAWIQRDWPIAGFPATGRQSYFEDSEYVATQFDRLGDIAVSDSATSASVVFRDGSISGMATKPERDDTRLDPVVVAGNRWDRGIAAMYSAAGLERGADIIATAETSRVLSDIRASGTMSDTSARLNGTSVAAPLVARWFTRVLQALPRKDYEAFSAVQHIADAPDLSPRPPLIDHDVATEWSIRKQRLATTAKVLPVGPLEQSFVKRDVLPKV